MIELPDIASDPGVLSLINIALTEDLGTGTDVTSESFVPADLRSVAHVYAKEDCVAAGLPVAAKVFSVIDSGLMVTMAPRDGDRVKCGECVMTVDGTARSILTAERTALNFLQRLFGIATLTNDFVMKVEGTGVMILDTRKTTPGWRTLEKYAVLCGGGTNHRMGLYDRVLMKDNHRVLWALGGGVGLSDAVIKARVDHPNLEIEVEVENEEELSTVLGAAPDWVLLDNMGSSQLRKCVDIAAGRCKLEASGGITLDNVGEVADAGVDAISLGCLTHSARSIDLSLELDSGARSS